MKIFKVFFQPDQEEQEQERDEIAEAANLLQTGEFQLLQLAYYDWHGHDLPEDRLDELFADYMIRKRVPSWARHYARRIIDGIAENRLDANDPAYHRYDRDYITYVPDGIRRFVWATLCCSAVFVVGLALATFAVDEPTSLLPPYFERAELAQER
jgi:hypothetical protein